MSARSLHLLRRLTIPAMVLALAVGGCVSDSGKPTSSSRTADSFRAKGQANLDRLNQNEMQLACSAVGGAPPDPAIATRLQTAALAAVKYPADGKFLGDWKAGEKIAQTGTGMQSSDDPAQPNGGNCYACHQLAPKEIAYGTLGPSLTQYGKLRGNSEAMLRLTWSRIWNAHAYNACSFMPRFGDAGVLTEHQIQDVMALLFDPASPVNQ